MQNKKQTNPKASRPRVFFELKKMKRYDGVVVSYGSIGCDYNIHRYDAQAKCECGATREEDCSCRINVPIIPIDLKMHKNEKYLYDPKPMLLFTIRHRRNPTIIYNYFSKDLADALDEINRLNGKAKRNTDDGFYLDETDFDEKWNRAAVAEYREKADFYE